MNRELIYKVTKLVRSSRDDRIRFMPMVVLLDAGLQSEVQEFLNLGCDDIIIYPCSAKDIARRLTTQVSAQHDYYETAHYFGPDRRRTEESASHPDRRDGEGFAYRHIVVKRSFDGDINTSTTIHHTSEHAKKAS